VAGFANLRWDSVLRITGSDSAMNFSDISRAAGFCCSLSMLREAKDGIPSKICEPCDVRSICTILRCRNARGTSLPIKSICPGHQQILKHYEINFARSTLSIYQRKQAKASNG